MGNSEMEDDERKAFSEDRMGSTTKALVVPFAGHTAVTPRHRTEYLDVQGRAFASAHEAQMSSFKYHVHVWKNGVLSPFLKNTSDAVVKAIFESREELIAILTPLRDAEADNQAFNVLASRSGTLPPAEAKVFRDGLVSGPTSHDDVDDEEPPEEERRVYTYQDMKDAFNLGVARGTKPGPMPKWVP